MSNIGSENDRIYPFLGMFLISQSISTYNFQDVPESLSTTDSECRMKMQNLSGFSEDLL